MTIINSSGHGVSVAGPDAPPPAARVKVDRRDHASREHLLYRVLAEYREMPCLRLTAEQARRLFGLRGDVSARVIDTLIKARRLRRDYDGRYVANDLT